MSARPTLLPQREANTRPVPYDLNAEKSVLAACLSRPESLLTIASFLSSNDFYSEPYQCIYAAMLGVHERGGKLNVVSVGMELRKRGLLEQAGGDGALRELYVGAGLRSDHAESYARIVRDRALRRELIYIGGRISGLGYEDEQDTDNLLAEAQAQMRLVTDKVGQDVWHDQDALVKAYFDQSDAIALLPESGIYGATSGLGSLDGIVGGFRPGELIVLAARTAMGKTAAALWALRRNCEGGKQVAFFSLEMSKEEISDRLIASVAAVDLADVRDRRYSANEEQRVMNATGVIAGWRFDVDETGRIGVNELRNRALARHARRPFDLLIVDYIQYVTGYGDNREQRVSDVSRSLKALTKELHVPILALAQLNREVEKRENKTPMLADLRESGSIEMDANVVIFLHRPGVYDEDKPDTTAVFTVEKNRNGKTGQTTVGWNGAYQRYAELDNWHS